MKQDILFTAQFNVYEVDLSDDGLGVIPCVIIQNNVGNKFSLTTIGAPLLDKKEAKGCLYYKMTLEHLGEKYACVSWSRQLSKARIVNKKPVDRIADEKTKEELLKFLYAVAGIKVDKINGKKVISDLSKEELELFYKKSEEC